jgi:hypothetical protein
MKQPQQIKEFSKRIRHRISAKKTSVLSVRINLIFIEHLTANFPTKAIVVNYYYRQGKIRGQHIIKTAYEDSWTAEDWQSFEDEVVMRLAKC